VAQLQAVANRTEVRQFVYRDEAGNPIPLLDENGDPMIEDGNPVYVQRAYRVFPGLARRHEIVCFQVVPQRTRRPANMDAVEPSIKVIFNEGGVNDQPSNVRRFFNWGLKRATDYGADVVLFLDNAAGFSEGDAETVLDFSERGWGRLVRAEVQRRLGADRQQVLRENLSTTAAYADLRARIDEEGLSRG